MSPADYGGGAYRDALIGGPDALFAGAPAKRPAPPGPRLLFVSSPADTENASPAWRIVLSSGVLAIEVEALDAMGAPRWVSCRVPRDVRLQAAVVALATRLAAQGPERL